MKLKTITSNGPCDPSLEVRKSCRKIVDEDIFIFYKFFAAMNTKKYQQ